MLEYCVLSLLQLQGYIEEEEQGSVCKGRASPTHPVCGTHFDQCMVSLVSHVGVTKSMVLVPQA